MQRNSDMSTTNKEVRQIAGKDYKFGFKTNIETDSIPKGLSEDIVKFISRKKEEPEWMLEWRLKAFRHFTKLCKEQKLPKWSNIFHKEIDFENIIYYAEPKTKKTPKSLDEVNPEIIETYNKLGIPLEEQKKLQGVAVDAVFDSVSVITTYKEELKKQGIIFCSMSEALKEYPELVKKYIGSVVPYTDNFYSALNSAVFSDGSFCYIPKGTKCPYELTTYFRINTEESGQFERTLIITEDDSYVSYLEGCSAPSFSTNQLHAAVVELITHKNSEIKYSTIQNWYPGNEKGVGGVYNFVTKRGKCLGNNSKISWTQVETGAAITWKYPSVILQGDNTIGEFYSVALTKGFQQADTGTKMIHIGKNTKSKIISKGISAGNSINTYRGQVRVNRRADNARNFTQCDSLLIGNKSAAHTTPYVEVLNKNAHLEHEAFTSRVSEDQLFYCNQRGLSLEDANALIINGFCKEVFKQLPFEFAVEASRLLEVNLEGAVG